MLERKNSHWYQRFTEGDSQQRWLTGVTLQRGGWSLRGLVKEGGTKRELTGGQRILSG